MRVDLRTVNAAVRLGRAVVAGTVLVLAASCGSVGTAVQPAVPPAQPAAAPAPVTPTAAPVVVKAPEPGAGATPAAPQGKTLLTFTGRIAATNTPGTRLRLDQAGLDRLGLMAVSVNDPWAKHRVALQGVWLRDVVALAHPDAAAATLHLRALDDYQADLNLADVRTAGIFLATRTDTGAPLPVEDGGPTRVVFTDDMASRFSPDLWIWNIDTIEVR